MEDEIAYRYLWVPFRCLDLPDLELLSHGLWFNKDVAGKLWVRIGSPTDMQQSGLAKLAKAGFSWRFFKLVYLALSGECTWICFDRMCVHTDEPSVYEVTPWDD